MTKNEKVSPEAHDFLIEIAKVFLPKNSYPCSSE
jgi:hypothetical protein